MYHYFIVVHFKNIGVSSLRKAVVLKHVGANSKIHNIQNCAFVVSDRIGMNCVVWVHAFKSQAVSQTRIFLFNS